MRSKYLGCWGAGLYTSLRYVRSFWRWLWGLSIDFDFECIWIRPIYQKFINICLNICLTMTTKTITIREDVYRMLMSIKGTRESFSNFFERMVISRRNLDKLKELRGFVEVKDKDALLKELSEKREEIRY